MRRYATAVMLMWCSLVFVTPATATQNEFDNTTGGPQLASGWRDWIPRSGDESTNDESPTEGISFVRTSNLSSSAAMITWISLGPSKGRVEYGPTMDLGFFAEEMGSIRVHSIWLKGLDPARTFFYRIHSDGATSNILSFTTAQVSAGRPRAVFGAIPADAGPSATNGDLIVSLRLVDRGSHSLPISARISTRENWMLNLGNLKTDGGGIFASTDEMFAEITIEGVGANGKPAVLHRYLIKLSDRPNGNLSQNTDDLHLTGKSVTPTVGYPVSSIPAVADRGLSPERVFLEGLLGKGKTNRAEGRKGRGYPHVIPGWRGGSTMGVSKPPKPGPPPNRVRLRGEHVLQEIIKLRNERSDARDFFPDVGRHFPGMENRLTRGIYPVSLARGVNILALPVDPDSSVTSFNILTENADATEVTAWDGELQQFGASAVRDGENIIGTDFQFVLGYGYFVLMDSPNVVTFEGIPQNRVAYVPTYAGLEIVSLVGNLDSVTSFTVFEELFAGDEICQFEPVTQSYQCAFRVGGGVYGDEFVLTEGTGYFVRSTEASHFPVDLSAPSATIVAPQDQDTIFTRQPFIDIIFGDYPSGVYLSSFVCSINGIDETANFTVDEFGATWQMGDGAMLLEGANTITATVSDSAENERVVASSFLTVTTPPAADEHFVNGYVFHADTWNSLPGVAVSIEGIPGVIYTDENGHYVFPMPGLGEYKLNFQMEHFTYAQRSLLIDDGWGDAFVDDAYLTPLDTILTRITPDGGVSVNSHASIITSFPPLTIDEDIDALTTQFDEPEDIPSPLPELSAFTYCADFGPDGPLLDTVYVDYLNHRDFLPGTPIPLGHYNSETMIWEDEGFAIVAETGSWLQFGLKHFSPVDPNAPVVPVNGPPRLTDEGDPDNDCRGDKASGSPTLGFVKSKFGGCLISHATPSVMSTGISRGLRFTYASHTAQPTVVIGRTIAPPADSVNLLPLWMGFQLDVVGQRFVGIFNASWMETRQRIRFKGIGADGQPLPTGLYNYGDVLANSVVSEYSEAQFFGGPSWDAEPGGRSGTGVYSDFPVGFRTHGRGDMIIDNRLGSEVGSGWSVEGLQRLYFRPDGDAMITVGGGAAMPFQRQFDQPALDLAITNRHDGTISVLLNDSLGGFSGRQDYVVGEWPSGGIVTDDFNGDGRNDLALTKRSDDNISILPGDGDGGFGPRFDYPVGDAPTGLAAGDFNQDGLPDLAVVSFGGQLVSILTNYPDVMFGNVGSGTKSLGNDKRHPTATKLATPGFVQSAAHPADGNPNDDGTLRESKSPRLRSDELSVGINPWGVVADDFNGDGWLDLAVANSGSGTVSVLLNDTSGSFASAVDFSVGSEPHHLVAADFNGDQQLDLAVVNHANNDISILMNDGNGDFSNRQDYPVGSFPWGIAAADFNEDGLMDLVVTNFNDGDVSILVNDGVGQFGDRFDYPIGSSLNSTNPVVGDFNGDGATDIAVTMLSNNSIAILYNNGDANFSGSQQFSVGSQPQSIVVGDFNRDYFESGYTSKEADFTDLTIHPSGFTRLYSDSSRIVFDTAGLHVASIDRNGNTTAFEYDGQNRLTTITYPGSLVTAITYGADGRIETVTDAASRTTYFDHDLDGNLISITDPDGSVHQYAYNDDHLMTVITDPRGFETTYEYDSNGYVTQIMAPDSATNRFLASNAYLTLNEALAVGDGTTERPADAVFPHEIVSFFVNTKGDTTKSRTNNTGKAVNKRDVRGHVWRYEYDEDGNKTKTTRPDITVMDRTWSKTGQMTSVTDNSNGAITRFFYDTVFDQLIMTINALDDTTRFELDGKGNTIRMINVLGDTTNQFYDSQGLITKRINALGDSTLYWYNAQGLVDSAANELGYVTKYEYGNAGFVTAITDPLGNRTEREYDANNRMTLLRDPLNRETELIYSASTNDLLLAVINPAGDTTHFEYDNRGFRVRTIDALKDTSWIEYDSEGQIVGTVDPEGRWVSFGYDKSGNLTSLVDSLGNITTMAYDSRKRRTSVTDPEGGVTEFAYDGADNVTHFIDPNSDSTSYTYDLLNRRTSETDPLELSKYYYYGPLDWLDSIRTADGELTRLSYDAVGKLLRKQYPVDSVVYQYDAVGKPIQVDDSDSRLVLTYNAGGRLTTVATGNGGNPNDLQPNTSIEYIYDAAGQELSMVYGSTDTTDYHYDTNGSLDSLADIDGEVFEFARDALGRITNVNRPNSTTTQYDYDRAGNVLSIVHRTGATILDSLMYTYDGSNRVTQLTNESDTVWYAYDSLGQVVGATYTDVAVPTESYEYDPAGNRLSSHLSTTYSHDDANQITEDDQWTYTSDNNGSLTQKIDNSNSDRWEYTYDYANRLIGVEKYDSGVTLSMEARYLYDGIGRRIAKIVDSDTTILIYNGYNITREYDPTGLVAAAHVSGLNVDEPLKITIGVSSYYYHTDRLGSTVKLSDEGGVVVESFTYDAFGNITDGPSGDHISTYTFTGREWDREIGQYFYRARFYYPVAGQFTSRDPIGFLAGDANLYRYVWNNPIGFVDPLGMGCYTPSRPNWGQIASGSLQMIGGFASLIGGLAAAGTGVGAVAGIPLAFTAGYSISAGWQNIMRGASPNGADSGTNVPGGIGEGIGAIISAETGDAEYQQRGAAADLFIGLVVGRAGEAATNTATEIISAAGAVKTFHGGVNAAADKVFD